MEEILASVSSPFSFENFRNLLELYLKAKNEQEFYYQIVEYHKDKKLSKDKRSVSVKDFDLEKFEHIVFLYPDGGWNIMEYFGDVFPAAHRIYINAPVDVAKEILCYFVSECSKAKLPFDLKFCDDAEGFCRNDSILIASHSSVYERHIEILRELARKRPELVQACGTPHILTGILDGWLGLCDERKNRANNSPTMEIKKCIRECLVVFLKNNPNILEELGDEKLSQKIKINDVENFFGELPTEIREKILKLIEEHPDVYEEIYNAFLERCENKGLRRENPIFYEDTPAMLIDSGRTTKKRMTPEMECLLLKADATDILILLLDDRVDEQLETADKVKMIERMVSLDIKDFVMDLALFRNLAFLIDEQLISETLIHKLEEVYGHELDYYFSDLLRERMETLVEYERYKIEGQPLFEDVYLSMIGSSELSTEQKKSKIQEALKQMQIYCESVRIDKVKMQQRLEVLEKALSKVGQTVYINCMSILREEIKITRYRLEHADEINELNEQISAEIASILERMEHENAGANKRKGGKTDKDSLSNTEDINDDDGEIDI